MTETPAATVLVVDEPIVREVIATDAGALTLELREVRLDGIVAGCVRGVEASAEARGIRLESRVDGAVPAVRCAPDHLEHVLLNLLTNALRHTPSDGSVAVLVASEPEGVRVSVEDTGEGIAPEALERVFERFWRADSARRRSGAGPAWDWRSRAAWSRPRAAASGPRSGRGAAPG